MFNDITTNALTAAIRGGSARQDVLAQNIANADTPGYKSRSLEFEGALAKAIHEDRSRMASSRLGSMAGAQWWDGHRPATHAAGEKATGKVGFDRFHDVGTTVRVDGSNVDPDDQMSKLAANQIAYNTANRLLAARFTAFQAAIVGR